MKSAVIDRLSKFWQSREIIVLTWVLRDNSRGTRDLGEVRRLLYCKSNLPHDTIAWDPTHYRILWLPGKLLAGRVLWDHWKKKSLPKSQRQYRTGMLFFVRTWLWGRGWDSLDCPYRDLPNHATSIPAKFRRCARRQASEAASSSSHQSSTRMFSKPVPSFWTPWIDKRHVRVWYICSSV